MTRKRRIDELITRLAAGETVAKSARLSGYAEKTVRRRLKDPEFRQKVERVRTEMLSTATARLTGIVAESVLTLKHLLTSESDSVRLGAVRTALESAWRYARTEEHERRIQEIEQRLRDREGGSEHHDEA